MLLFKCFSDKILPFVFHLLFRCCSANFSLLFLPFQLVSVNFRFVFSKASCIQPRVKRLFHRRVRVVRLPVTFIPSPVVLLDSVQLD